MMTRKDIRWTIWATGAWIAFGSLAIWVIKQPALASSSRASTRVEAAPGTPVAQTSVSSRFKSRTATVQGSKWDHSYEIRTKENAERGLRYLKAIHRNGGPLSVYDEIVAEQQRFVAKANHPKLHSYALTEPGKVRDRRMMYAGSVIARQKGVKQYAFTNVRWIVSSYYDGEAQSRRGYIEKDMPTFYVVGAEPPAWIGESPKNKKKK